MKKRFQTHSGSFGWVVILTFATIYDVIVIKKGQESLSGAIWANTKHPFYGPVILGLWSSISYHLLIEKIIQEKREKNA